MMGTRGPDDMQDTVTGCFQQTWKEGFTGCNSVYRSWADGCVFIRGDFDKPSLYHALTDGSIDALLQYHISALHGSVIM